MKFAQVRIAVVIEDTNPTLELVESAKDGMLKNHTSINTCLLIIQMTVLSQTYVETQIPKMDSQFGAILKTLTEDGIGVIQWTSLCLTEMSTNSWRENTLMITDMISSMYLIRLLNLQCKRKGPPKIQRA